MRCKGLLLQYTPPKKALNAGIAPRVPPTLLPGHQDIQRECERFFSAEKEVLWREGVASMNHIDSP